MNDADEKVYLWAARRLDVDRSQVAKVEFDSWGLCSTCEFSGGEIRITLTDGQVFEGEEQFGLALRDIFDLDLNEDGTPSKYAYNLEAKHMQLRAVPAGELS